MPKNEIAWDLSEMFKGPDDSRINEVLKKLDKQVDEFIRDYKGKLNFPEFSADDFLVLLKKQEDFTADFFEFNSFARLSFSANMTIPEIKTLFNKAQEFSAKIGAKLAFLEIETGKYVYENEQVISDPKLESYKHSLEKLKRSYPHRLSEIEEQLIIEKDQYGIIGWQQLQSKWLNTRLFDVEVEGETKKLSYGEANGLLAHPDKDTRRSANKAIYGVLGKDEEIFSSAMHNICSDWVKTSKRRKYDSPMHQSLIANDVDKEIIDNLMKAIDEHSVIYRRYLTLKAKMLNLPKLSCEDLVAPLPDVPNIEYTWKRTQELILKAYGNFDEDFYSTAKDMFERNHIDASPRMGKRNGAFCASWYKGKTSYILQTFTGALGNVYTLAHELGHAVHGYMVSREQSIINARYPMVIAEVASIFGELLLTDLLLSEAETKEEKKAILSRVLDGAGMATFQVSARVWFEQSMYETVENGCFLDGKTISKLWTSARDKIYGDAVEWFEEMDFEWTMKPHYYMPNFRFYNYPYVFAQMFVYTLYQLYKEQGEAFIPKLKLILKSGGSKSPKEFGEMMGLDITKPDFWKLGMKQYERFVDELEKLIE
ncbi:MAG: M3 family oligoendopeptidase [Candidatus Heimdallarchaeota archaeon]|nr:M3 family oligoendopeptidase [Candidatus Heimdallarchaeota archaeon]MCK4254261.1 M3 family oligoendopeptidase [Candidatus Heimdallarchaeota archaeon]